MDSQVKKHKSSLPQVHRAQSDEIGILLCRHRVHGKIKSSCVDILNRVP